MDKRASSRIYTMIVNIRPQKLFKENFKKSYIQEMYAVITV